MPIYQKIDSYDNPTLYFWGDIKTWDNLIIKNCKATENVYVCDQTIPLNYYPPKVKVIKSKQTAKRFLAGLNLNKSAVFINMDNFEKSHKFIAMTYYHRFQYLIIYINTKEFFYLLKHNVLETSSKRNIRHLRKYK